MSKPPVDLSQLSYIISLGDDKISIEENPILDKQSYTQYRENEESFLKGVKKVLFELGTKPSNISLCGSKEIKSYFRDMTIGDINIHTKVMCGTKKDGKWKFSGKPHKRFQAKIDNGTIEEWEMSIADIDKYFNLLKSQENKDKEVIVETPVIILKGLNKDLQKAQTELKKLNDNINNTKKELESAEISKKGAEDALIAGGIKSGVPKSLSSSVTRRKDKIHNLESELTKLKNKISELDTKIDNTKIEVDLYEARKSVEGKDIAT